MLMKGKMITFTLMIALILIGTVKAQSLSVMPSSQSVSLWSGTTATVNVSANSVTNLYGYQYNIQYNQAVVNITSTANIVEGPFLKTGSVTTLCVPSNISTQGLIRNIACTRTGSTGVSGTGNITKITFALRQDVVPPLSAYVRIAGDKLSDINSQPLSHTVSNGTISVYACLSGETRPCSSNVGKCVQGTLTCNSSNYWPASNPANCVGGVFPDPAELCNNIDDDCDGSTDESLSRSCSVAHNGTCASGTETCAVGVWAGCPVPLQEICYNSIDEDCDGSDSSCLGDVDSSGCIDIQDMSMVATDFGKTSGFDPRVDINDDGQVDIFDLVYVGKDFGVGSC
jgi:hypothetical protein